MLLSLQEWVNRIQKCFWQCCCCIYASTVKETLEDWIDCGWTIRCDGLRCSLSPSKIFITTTYCMQPSNLKLDLIQSQSFSCQVNAYMEEEGDLHWAVARQAFARSIWKFPLSRLKCAPNSSCKGCFHRINNQGTKGESCRVSNYIYHRLDWSASLLTSF